MLTILLAYRLKYAIMVDTEVRKLTKQDNFDSDDITPIEDHEDSTPIGVFISNELITVNIALGGPSRLLERD